MIPARGAVRRRIALRWAALVAASAALHVGALTVVHDWQTAGHGARRSTPAVRPEVRVSLVEARVVAALPEPAAAPLVAMAPIAALPAVDVAAVGPLAAAPALAALAPAALPAVPAPEPEPDRAAAADDAPPRPHYHRLAELTQRPMLLTPIALELPARPAQPGRMRMRLLISEHGLVDEIVVDESTLGGDEQRFAIERFATVRYEPGRIEDRPVRSQVLIEVSTEGG